MAGSEKNDSYFIGVDFGGTKILSGVFTRSLELVGTEKISTKAIRTSALTNPFHVDANAESQTMTTSRYKPCPSNQLPKSGF